MLRPVVGSWALVLVLACGAFAADPMPQPEEVYAPGFAPVSYFAPFGNCCGSTPKCKNWWAVPPGASHLGWTGYCGECNFQQPLGGCGEGCNDWTPMLGLSRIGQKCRGCDCDCGSCSRSRGRHNCTGKPSCDSCASKPTCECQSCASKSTCNCPTCASQPTCHQTCDSRPPMPMSDDPRTNPFHDDPPMPMAKPMPMDRSLPPLPIPTDEAPPAPMPMDMEPIKPMKARATRGPLNDRTAAVAPSSGVVPAGYVQATDASPAFNWVADEAPAPQISSRRVRPAVTTTAPPAVVRPATVQPAVAVQPEGNTLKFR